MSLRGVNHITLAVADLDRAWAFWVDGLGCRPLMRSPRSVYLLAGDLWLCLVRSVARVAPAPGDYTHIALSVDAADFAALSARVLAAGGRPFQDNRSEGDSLYFLCPDDHKLELHVGDWRSRLAGLRGDDVEHFPLPDAPPDR